MAGQEIDDRVLGVLIRVCVFLSGLGMMGVGVLRLLRVDFEEPFEVFLYVYYVLFGVLLCLMELPWEKPLEFFGFLRTCIGKSVYLLFCATLLINLNAWWEVLIAIVCIVSALIYLVLALSCKHKIVEPKEEKKGEGKGEEKAKGSEDFHVMQPQV